MLINISLLDVAFITFYELFHSHSAQITLNIFSHNYQTHDNRFGLSLGNKKDMVGTETWNFGSDSWLEIALQKLWVCGTCGSDSSRHVVIQNYSVYVQKKTISIIWANYEIIRVSPKKGGAILCLICWFTSYSHLICSFFSASFGRKGSSHSSTDEFCIQLLWHPSCWHLRKFIISCIIWWKGQRFSYKSISISSRIIRR